MKTWLMVLFFMVGADSYAATGFEQTLGGEDSDRGIYLSPTKDGGFVVVGVRKSLGKGAEDVILVRMDAQGEVQWTRTFGGPDPDFGWSVLETPDGFVFAGFTQSFGKGDHDFYLVKTDPEGATQWSRTFGGMGKDRCWALALASDGGFVLAGETTSSGEGEEDFFLVKTDSLGAEQWSQRYGGEKSDRCFSLVEAEDGGFVLAGQTYSEGAGDRDVFVVKTSARGELEWSRTFGGEASDVGHSVIKTSDGCFLVTGYTTSLATVDDDPYLIKIDGQGNTIWTRVLPLEGINHTLTGDQANDGGFYLVGFSKRHEQGGTTALLVKADAEGKLQWYRDVVPADSDQSFGYTVRATRDGGCAFTGHTATNSTGDLDLLLVKEEGEGQE